MSDGDVGTEQGSQTEAGVGVIEKESGPSVLDRIGEISNDPKFVDNGIGANGKVTVDGNEAWNKLAFEAADLLRDEGTTPYKQGGLEKLQKLYEDSYTEYKTWSRDNGINTVANPALIMHPEGRKFQLVNRAVDLVDSQAMGWIPVINRKVVEALDSK
jgi:hypothetical protein